MAYAVNLLFNHSLADAVAERWRRLADTGLSRSMLNLGYPPHVTLTVYDTLDADVATVALDQVFEKVARMFVMLTNVTTFGAGSGVLYAALEPSPDLMRLHAVTAAAIGQVCRPYYRPGGWSPHCTLATGIDDANLEHARAALEEDWRPQSGFFETATFVEFLPVAGIKSWTLADPSHSTRTP